MTTKRNVLLIGIFCVVIIAFVKGADGQRTKESHPLLASLFNVANDAVSHGRAEIVQHVNKIEPVDQAIAIGPISSDIMCSLCQKQNNIECMNIHCVKVQPLPLPPTPNNGVFQRNAEMASQLRRHESLHSNLPNNIDSGHSTLRDGINGGKVPSQSDRVHQTLPLSWTESNNPNQLNRVPQRTSFEQTGQIFNQLFNAQQLLNRQTPQRPFVPRQPSFTTDQWNVLPPRNFNPNIAEQINNGMPQQGVSHTLPKINLPGEGIVMDVNAGNQQTSTMDTRNAAWDQMQQVPIDTLFTGPDQQPAIDNNFNNDHNVGTPVTWERPRSEVFNGNQQNQPITSPNVEQLDTTNQFNGRPFPDMDVSSGHLPQTSDSNGIQPSIPVISLPGENGPFQIDNSVQIEQVNPGQHIDATQNGLPQNIQEFFPDGFIESAIPSMQNDQSNTQQSVDIPVAHDMFAAPNEANPTQVVITNNGAQHIVTGAHTPDVSPHMKMFETGSQVVRDTLAHTEPVSTNQQPTSSQHDFIDNVETNTMNSDWGNNPSDPVQLPEFQTQETGTRPVDLLSAIVTPFRDAARGQNIPARSNIFLDFGQGAIMPQQNHVTIHNTHPSSANENANILIDHNQPQNHFANNPTTDIITNSNSGQEINGGHADNLWPITGGSNAHSDPNIDMSPNNDRQNFAQRLTASGTNRRETMTMLELHEFLNARNEASGAQTGNGHAETNQGMFVSNTNPVSLDSHSGNAQDGLSNINNNIPQQRAHFVDFAHGTPSNAPVQFADLNNGMGMDLTGQQQFETQEFESTTNLPTISPRRKGQLNQLSARFLGGFVAK